MTAFQIPESAQGLLGRKNVAVYDEHRNTSRVHPVPAGSLEAALTALERFRVDQPEHAQWIEDGAPTLTEAEHYQRFGEPYNRTRTKPGKENA